MPRRTWMAEAEAEAEVGCVRVGEIERDGGGRGVVHEARHFIDTHLSEVGHTLPNPTLVLTHLRRDTSSTPI